MWLYYRYHVNKEEWNFASNQSWFDLVLIHGKDVNSEMCYQAQYERTKFMHGLLGINCMAVCHATRGSGARMAAEQG